MEDSDALFHRAVLGIAHAAAPLGHQCHPGLFRFRAGWGLEGFVAVPDDVFEEVGCVAKGCWLGLALVRTVMAVGFSCFGVGVD